MKSKHQLTHPKSQTFKADYQGATPEQVAEAILRYRPDKKAKAKADQKR